MDEVRELLADLAQLGIRLAADNGQLRISAGEKKSSKRKPDGWLTKSAADRKQRTSVVSTRQRRRNVREMTKSAADGKPKKSVR